MSLSSEEISRNVRNIFSDIPRHVTVVAVAKTRSPEEIAAAVGAGITIVGENYIQEVKPVKKAICADVEWHLIGHLQTNKAKQAVRLFDMIETVDSEYLAREIDHQSRLFGKVMPVLIEVNIGREHGKTGIMPEGLRDLKDFILKSPNLRLQGLMTLGPNLKPEKLRSYFAEVHKLYSELQADIPGDDFRFLSMGMSESYRVAIEEGANIIRVGSAIFGPRC